MSLALFLLSCLANADRPLPFYDAKDMTPFWSSEAEVHAQPATVGAFKAVDQEHGEISEAGLAQQISLVNFFFTECGSLCPTMMHTLQRFQAQESTEPFTLYSFSVKPEHDQPSQLKAYAHAQHLDLKRWKLLTGTRDEIYRVGREMFKADGSVGPAKQASKFIHTRNVYLVDRQRRIRGIYDSGSDAAMQLLASDIKRLVKE